MTILFVSDAMLAGNIEVSDSFRVIFLFVSFIRHKDIEDRTWNMMLVEVYFILLSTLFTETSRESIDRF